MQLQFKNSKTVTRNLSLIKSLLKNIDGSEQVLFQPVKLTEEKQIEVIDKPFQLDIKFQTKYFPEPHLLQPFRYEYELQIAQLPTHINDCFVFRRKNCSLRIESLESFSHKIQQYFDIQSCHMTKTSDINYFVDQFGSKINRIYIKFPNSISFEYNLFKIELLKQQINDQSKFTQLMQVLKREILLLDMFAQGLVCGNSLCNLKSIKLLKNMQLSPILQQTHGRNVLFSYSISPGQEYYEDIILKYLATDKNVDKFIGTMQGQDFLDHLLTDYEQEFIEVQIKIALEWRSTQNGSIGDFVRNLNINFKELNNPFSSFKPDKIGALCYGKVNQLSKQLYSVSQHYGRHWQPLQEFIYNLRLKTESAIFLIDFEMFQNNVQSLMMTLQKCSFQRPLRNRLYNAFHSILKSDFDRIYELNQETIRRQQQSMMKICQSAYDIRILTDPDDYNGLINGWNVQVILQFMKQYFKNIMIGINNFIESSMLKASNFMKVTDPLWFIFFTLLDKYYISTSNQIVDQTFQKLFDYFTSIESYVPQNKQVANNYLNYQLNYGISRVYFTVIVQEIDDKYEICTQPSINETKTQIKEIFCMIHDFPNLLDDIKLLFFLGAKEEQYDRKHTVQTSKSTAVNKILDTYFEMLTDNIQQIQLFFDNMYNSDVQSIIREQIDNINSLREWPQFREIHNIFVNESKIFVTDSIESIYSKRSQVNKNDQCVIVQILDEIIKSYQKQASKLNLSTIQHLSSILVDYQQKLDSISHSFSLDYQYIGFICVDLRRIKQIAETKCRNIICSIVSICYSHLLISTDYLNLIFKVQTYILQREPKNPQEFQEIKNFIEIQFNKLEMIMLELQQSVLLIDKLFFQENNHSFQSNEFRRQFNQQIILKINPKFLDNYADIYKVLYDENFNKTQILKRMIIGKSANIKQSEQMLVKKLESQRHELTIKNQELLLQIKILLNSIPQTKSLYNIDFISIQQTQLDKFDNLLKSIQLFDKQRIEFNDNEGLMSIQPTFFKDYQQYLKELKLVQILWDQLNQHFQDIPYWLDTPIFDLNRIYHKKQEFQSKIQQRIVDCNQQKQFHQTVLKQQVINLIEQQSHQNIINIYYLMLDDLFWFSQNSQLFLTIINPNLKKRHYQLISENKLQIVNCDAYDSIEQQLKSISLRILIAQNQVFIPRQVLIEQYKDQQYSDQAKSIIECGKFAEEEFKLEEEFQIVEMRWKNWRLFIKFNRIREIDDILQHSANDIRKIEKWLRLPYINPIKRRVCNLQEKLVQCYYIFSLINACQTLAAIIFPLMLKLDVTDFQIVKHFNDYSFIFESYLRKITELGTPFGTLSLSGVITGKEIQIEENIKEGSHFSIIPTGCLMIPFFKLSKSYLQNLSQRLENECMLFALKNQRSFNNISNFRLHIVQILMTDNDKIKADLILKTLPIDNIQQIKLDDNEITYIELNNQKNYCHVKCDKNLSYFSNVIDTSECLSFDKYCENLNNWEFLHISVLFGKIFEQFCCVKTLKNSTIVRQNLKNTIEFINKHSNRIENEDVRNLVIQLCTKITDCVFLDNDWITLFYEIHCIFKQNNQIKQVINGDIVQVNLLNQNFKQINAIIYMDMLNTYRLLAKKIIIQVSESNLDHYIHFCKFYSLRSLFIGENCQCSSSQLVLIISQCIEQGIYLFIDIKFVSLDSLSMLNTLTTRILQNINNGVQVINIDGISKTISNNFRLILITTRFHQQWLQSVYFNEKYMKTNNEHLKMCQQLIVFNTQLVYSNPCYKQDITRKIIFATNKKFYDTLKYMSHGTVYYNNIPFTMNSCLLKTTEFFKEYIINASIVFVCNHANVEEYQLRNNFLVLYQSYLAYGKKNKWLSKINIHNILIFCIFNGIATFLDEHTKSIFNTMIKKIIDGKSISDLIQVPEIYTISKISVSEFKSGFDFVIDDDTFLQWYNLNPISTRKAKIDFLNKIFEASGTLAIYNTTATFISSFISQKDDVIFLIKQKNAADVCQDIFANKSFVRKFGLINNDINDINEKLHVLQYFSQQQQYNQQCELIFLMIQYENLNDITIQNCFKYNLLGQDEQEFKNQLQIHQKYCSQKFAKFIERCLLLTNNHDDIIINTLINKNFLTLQNYIQYCSQTGEILDSSEQLQFYIQELQDVLEYQVDFQFQSLIQDYIDNIRLEFCLTSPSTKYYVVSKYPINDLQQELNTLATYAATNDEKYSQFITFYNNQWKNKLFLKKIDIESEIQRISKANHASFGLSRYYIQSVLLMIKVLYQNFLSVRDISYQFQKDKIDLVSKLIGIEQIKINTMASFLDMCKKALIRRYIVIIEKQSQASSIFQTIIRTKQYSVFLGENFIISYSQTIKSGYFDLVASPQQFLTARQDLFASLSELIERTNYVLSHNILPIIEGIDDVNEKLYEPDAEFLEINNKSPISIEQLSKISRVSSTYQPNILENIKIQCMLMQADNQNITKQIALNQFTIQIARQLSQYQLDLVESLEQLSIIDQQHKINQQELTNQLVTAEYLYQQKIDISNKLPPLEKQLQQNKKVFEFYIQKQVKEYYDNIPKILNLKDVWINNVVINTEDTIFDSIQVFLQQTDSSVIEFSDVIKKFSTFGVYDYSLNQMLNFIRKVNEIPVVTNPILFNLIKQLLHLREIFRYALEKQEQFSEIQRQIIEFQSLKIKEKDNLVKNDVEQQKLSEVKETVYLSQRNLDWQTKWIEELKQIIAKIQQFQRSSDSFIQYFKLYNIQNHPEGDQVLKTAVKCLILQDYSPIDAAQLVQDRLKSCNINFCQYFNFSLKQQSILNSVQIRLDSFYEALCNGFPDSEDFFVKWQSAIMTKNISQVVLIIDNQKMLYNYIQTVLELIQKPDNVEQFKTNVSNKQIIIEIESQQLDNIEQYYELSHIYYCTQDVIIANKQLSNIKVVKFNSPIPQKELYNKLKLLLSDEKQEEANQQWYYSLKAVRCYYSAISSANELYDQYQAYDSSQTEEKGALLHQIQMSMESAMQYHQNFQIIDNTINTFTEQNLKELSAEFLYCSQVGVKLNPGLNTYSILQRLTSVKIAKAFVDLGGFDKVKFAHLYMSGRDESLVTALRMINKIEGYLYQPSLGWTLMNCPEKYLSELMASFCKQSGVEHRFEPEKEPLAHVVVQDQRSAEVFAAFSLMNQFKPVCKREVDYELSHNGTYAAIIEDFDIPVYYKTILQQYTFAWAGDITFFNQLLGSRTAKFEKIRLCRAIQPVVDMLTFPKPQQINLNHREMLRQKRDLIRSRPSLTDIEALMLEVSERYSLRLRPDCALQALEYFDNGIVSCDLLGELVVKLFKIVGNGEPVKLRRVTQPHYGRLHLRLLAIFSFRSSELSTYQNGLQVESALFEAEWCGAANGELVSVAGQSIRDTGILIQSEGLVGYTYMEQ